MTNKVIAGRWQDHLGLVSGAAMIYADPPYGTGRTFIGYEDRSTLPEWSQQILSLLDVSRNALSSDGVMWIHLDDRRAHVARTLGDDVFGASSRVGTIAWQRTASGGSSTGRLTRQTDYITGWARSAAFRLRPVPVSKYSASVYANPDGDPRPWRRDVLAAPGGRTSGSTYGITNPMTGTVYWPGPDKHWRWNLERTRAALAGWGHWTLDDQQALGIDPSYADAAAAIQKKGPWPLIYFGIKGTTGPQIKTYGSMTASPGNFWTCAETGTTSDAIRQVRSDVGHRAFDTPKPLGLMTKLIAISTDPGDLVVDPYAGSGSTGVAAALSGRSFALMESSAATVADVLRPRLDKNAVNYETI